MLAIRLKLSGIGRDRFVSRKAFLTRRRAVWKTHLMAIRTSPTAYPLIMKLLPKERGGVAKGEREGADCQPSAGTLYREQ